MQYTKVATVLGSISTLSRIMNAADKTVLNKVILKQRSFIFEIFQWREKFLTALCKSNKKTVGTQLEPRKPQSNLKAICANSWRITFYLL
jgi:hypothetical protein